MKRLLVAAVGLASLGFASASVPATAADLGPSRMVPVSAPAYLPFNWGGWYAGLNLGGGFGDVTASSSAARLATTGRSARSCSVSRPTCSIPARTTIVLPSAARAATQELDWFGTFRGRIGCAIWDRWLPYFTGGLAYGGRSVTVNGVTADDTAIGWAIGVGVDYAITPKWSARLEYLHISLEDFYATFPASAVVNAGRLDNDIIRGAVNYRFMPSY